MTMRNLLWAAPALAIIVILSIATLTWRQPDPGDVISDRPDNSDAPAVDTSADVALHRCQLLAEPDDTCRKIWSDNRKHFLGQATVSTTTDHAAP